jgi:hypothetical protein
VAYFREAFFDAHGAPNELFYQLTSLVSLYQFEQVNVNSASPVVMRVWSGLSEQEASRLVTEDAGGGKSVPYYRNLEEASRDFGFPLPSDRYTVTTNCIRVNVTVTEGPKKFLLTTVVAPGPGVAATLVPPKGRAEAAPEARGDSRGQRGRRDRTAAPAATENAAQQSIGYPFTFLETRENESIL